MGLHAFVHEHLPAARVLEVGCGRGDLARAMARAGDRVAAIDPDAPDGDLFRTTTLEDFTEPEPFDAVVASAISPGPCPSTTGANSHDSNPRPTSRDADAMRFERQAKSLQIRYFWLVPDMSTEQFPQSVDTSVTLPSGPATTSGNKKGPDLQGLLQAADGTRTHDLLHGKQTPIARSRPLCPCKWSTSALQ
jgi:hypothetical protein